MLNIICLATFGLHCNEFSQHNHTDIKKFFKKDARRKNDDIVIFLLMTK